MVFSGGQWLDGPPVWPEGATQLSIAAVWKLSRANDADRRAQSIVEQADDEMARGGRAALLTVGSAVQRVLRRDENAVAADAAQNERK